jgi:hypothetical protein
MAEQSQNPGAVTNTFTKGMVKDMNETFVGEGLWTHARNLVNNSHDGHMGVVGNEPANLHCVTLPYELIGCIHLTDDQWAIFTTDDINSEIGVFDESRCSYTKKVNDPCLNFKRTNLITGISRKRYDCDRPVYFADGLNPDRFIDLDNPPYKYTTQIVNDCAIKIFSNQLDCEKIRIAALVEHPCFNIKKGKSAGTLPNGSYQVCLAYTINQVRITDYIGLSEVQSLFDHDNVSSSLEVTVVDVDKNFDEFELVLVAQINSQTIARRVGYYSTNQGTIYIDNISNEQVTVPIADVVLRTEPVEKSDALYQVNNYALRVGVYSKTKFNYQPQANKIRTSWVAVEYNADYYHKAGNNTGYMKDEQYAFFIRWIYNTGERSESYHIPGRAPLPGEESQVFGGDAYETVGNAADVQNRKLWQVQNTATIESIIPSTLTDGGRVKATGKMAYWESTERYPDNRQDIWQELCGKPIRHHKMPDETVSPLLNNYDKTTDRITVLGVQFDNITHPLDRLGNPIVSVVGYEILRGSRQGNKSIVAKGMLNNLRQYDIPGSTANGLYQNYPYNDLRTDYLLTSDIRLIDPSLARVTGPDDDETMEVSDLDSNDTDDEDLSRAEERRLRRQERQQRRADRREARRRLREQREKLKAGRTGRSEANLDAPLTQYKKDYLSFHSPDTQFSKPFLGVSELKVYQEISGKSQGFFHHPYKHPKFKTLTNFAGIFSSIITTIVAVGNVLSVISHDSDLRLSGTEALSYEKKLTLSKIPNFPIEANFLGTGASVPNPVIVVQNSIIGIYNSIVAVAMTFLEASAVGEQLLNIIYGMVPKRQNALQFDSHGFYDSGVPKQANYRRYRIDRSGYIGNSVNTFDADHTINNVHRAGFVALKIDRELTDPAVIDESRYRFNKIGKIDRIGQTNISAHYGAIKVSVASQYGQLESIKQIPISYCIHPATGSGQKYKTDVLFGGDVYVNRFTEKNSFFFFNTWLMGEPDLTEFDYRAYAAIAYPRFWIDSTRQSYKLFGNVSNGRSLDEVDSSLFFVAQGYFYLFYSGVRDFFVESEINLAYRDWEDTPAKRHYDPYQYRDYPEMFRSDIIKEGNFYKYDYSLSVAKLFNSQISWANILPRDFDPITAESCYSYYADRVIYSLPQQMESKKDNWRVYLPNNYRDFGSPISSVKPINRSGALFMMRRQSPLMFMGQEELKLDGTGAKVTIGDGALFSTGLQNIVNVDESYEYGSCQSKWATLNCTHGVFWVSQDQGKIFQYAGSLNEISRDGMKWWFSRYLPSELLKVYPNYPLTDNPLQGIGVQMIYDNTNEIIYVSKIDYKPLMKDLIYDQKGFYKLVGGVKTYYPFTDKSAWEDASWTISYDPKNKMWLSFHDWKPTYVIPGKSHFMTVNRNSIWKHNSRCDLFCNYYGVDHPFEVEFVSATGQTVNSVRNVEYLMEAYRFYNDCGDKLHLLDENFDQAMIYNSEQISGLLEMDLKSKANPVAMLSYPQIQPQSIKILYSKEENKYRFNQFWDITKNRGEFSAANIPMFTTKANGYEFQINPQYVNYQKAPLERKKFRHNVNRVWLRKFKSSDTKIIFKISNQKLLQSPR